jgi:mannitol 2-dehydrogenase
VIPVSQPGYARADISVGILHFGVGNFHRSHQAMYLDTLFNAGTAHEWGICGVGVMPSDVHMRDALESQDLRYTLVERHADGTTPARTIGSIVEYLFAPDDPELVLERLADPATKIVSLTITEGGYNVDDATGLFDANNAAILKDLEPGAVPATVFALVVEGLRRRRDRGIPPFTVMSCDNIEGNGHVAQASFTAFAALRDPGLADWIHANVAFPNSMVDRITPVTTDADRAFVLETFGVEDAWPVLSEPFVQWVLEDDFTLGRPPYELVGVQVVQDVAPYERMKLRLLNASHQALAYFGYLIGHRFAHEAAADPDMIRLLTRYMAGEAEPTLASVPGIDLAEYKQTLLERFANPYVRDTLARLATDASDRIAGFLLPVVNDRLAAGAAVPMSAAIVAAWAVFARGVDEQGEPITVADRQAGLVAEAVTRQESDPLGFLRDPRLFGSLADAPVFSEAFRRTYDDIRSSGARRALASLLDA